LFRNRWYISTIETTCFGLYWPSSGFYKIEKSSIIAVTTVEGYPVL